jgi:HD-GYP domain-containing protein (c-di-GMP phosphodiesterase class II)
MTRLAPQVGGAEGQKVEDDVLEPVSLTSLQVLRSYEFDLYLRTDRGFSLYRAQHTDFEEGDRQRLLENGVGELYVRREDKPAYRKYLVSQLQTVVTDDRLPLPERCQVTARCAQAISEELFEDPGRLELYDEAGNVVRSTTSLVLREPDAVDGLARMLRHDYYTSTHLINVSVLSLMLSLRLGIRDQEELQRIGMGGLLHDLGKTRIDPAILNCKQRLTDAQMAELRRHPDYGMMIMMDLESPEVCREVLRMVHQHHERLDGSGYPVGLRGKEISRCSQICAVVDVYDAMTCKRPYRDALPMQTALDHLAEQRDKQLEGEIVDAWLATAPTLGGQQLSGIEEGSARGR